MIFISCDADNAGRKVGQAVMTNDPDKVKSVSSIIESGENWICDWTKQHGGSIISLGGDEARVMVPDEAESDVEAFRQKYFEITGFTISVGIGSSMKEGETSLIAAKLTGKNKTVKYSPETEKIAGELESKNDKDEFSKEKDAYFKSETFGVGFELLAGNDKNAELEELSRRQSGGLDAIRLWAQSVTGSIVYLNGTDAVLKIPIAANADIENLRAVYKAASGSTCSVGVGSKISECMDARQLAKLTGKDRIVYFDENTENELALRLQDQSNTEANKIKTAQTNPSSRGPNSVTPVSEVQPDPIFEADGGDDDQENGN